MGTIIDIIIVIIIAGTIITAIKNGFVKTALGTLGFFIAAAVAFCFYSPLGTALANKGLSTRIETSVDTAVDAVIKNENYLQLFGAESDEDGKSAVAALFSGFGAEEKYDEIKDSYNEKCRQGIETVKDYLKSTIKVKAVPFCSNAAAFLILFFGMRILLVIAEFVLNKLTELPTIKKANMVLGGVLGAVLSVLRVSIFCFAARLIVPVGSALGIEFLAQVDMNQSFLYRLFEGGNIISALI